MSTTGRLRWLLRGVEVLIAAAVMLVVLDLHGAIIRSAATLAGLRSSSPLILAVDGSCKERETWVPPLLRDLESRGRPGAIESEKATIAACIDRPRILTTAPVGRDTLLFVNGTFVDARRSENAFALFMPAMRPGLNHVAVRDASGYAPYPTLGWSGHLLRPDRDPTFRFFGVWHSRPPRVESVWIEQPLPPGPVTEPWYWTVGRERWRLELAPPLGIAIAPEPDARNIGIDGFRLLPEPASASDAPDSPSDTLPRRRLTIARDASGTMSVHAEACLPSAHVFVEMARDLRMFGTEFVARLFQAEIQGWLPLHDPQWRHPPVVTVEQPAPGAPCVALSTRYTVPRAWFYFSAGRDGSFLASPADELVLAGFDASVQGGGKAPDEVTSGRMVWRGAGIDTSRLRLWVSAEQDQRAPAAAVETQSASRASVFAAWRRLPSLLPRLVSATLWGLAAVAPVALMLFALTRHVPEAPSRDRIVRARAGLWALVAFGAAFALRDPIFATTRWLMRLVDLDELSFDPVSERGAGSELHVSLAIVVVILVVPLLQRLADTDMGRWSWLRRLPAALLSVGLVGAGIAVLFALNLASSARDGDRSVIANYVQDAADLVGPLATDVVGDPGLGLVVLVLLVAWLAAGLTLFWAPARWLLGATFPRGRFGGAALVAGWLLFVVPLLVPCAEAVLVVTGLALGSPLRTGAAGVHGAAGFVAAVAWIGPALVLIVIVALVLRCLREIAAAMLDDKVALRVRHWLRMRVLMLAAFVIVVPVIDQLVTHAGGAEGLVYRLMRVFQSYGLVLALLAPFAAMQAFESGIGAGDPFDVPRGLANVAAAAFAGYLTLWVAEPMTVLLLILIGWFLFSRRVIDIDAVRGLERAAPGSGERLIAALAELRLLDTRKAALEKSFGDGKLRPVAFNIQRGQLAAMRGVVTAGLTDTPAALRRRLLAFGPERSPLANAILGAKSGLAAAIIFQILLRVDLGAAAGPNASGWLGLLRAVMVDPEYGLAGTEGLGSQLIVLVNAVVNAAAVWVIVGFLFGYVFHLIWGKDGFVKALIFGAGIAVPYLLSQAILVAGASVPAGQFMRLVPLLLFLFVLGTLVFDGGSLRRAGIGVAQLPEIYGLRTSVGYLSFAGVLATAQPVLQFIQWMLP